MKHKSWHLDRRDLLKGGGIAIALPFLNGMGSGLKKAMGSIRNAAGESEQPKRMLVSYFAYGAYMPESPSGVPRSTGRTDDKEHNPWSWWPCKDAGPLSFNESSSPFKPLKDDISYLRGLIMPEDGNLAATVLAMFLPPALT